MTLHIRDAEAEQLARELARRTGSTMTGVVVTALRDLRAREERKARDVDALVEEAMAIGRHCASLPVLDNRTLEEMLYDEHGLPA